MTKEFYVLSLESLMQNDIFKYVKDSSAIPATIDLKLLEGLLYLLNQPITFYNICKIYFNFEEDNIIKILTFLKNNNIVNTLIDENKLIASFNSLSSIYPCNNFKQKKVLSKIILNPPNVELGTLSQAILKRKSESLKKKDINFNDLTTLLYFGYGLSNIDKRTIPSAGALYPLYLTVYIKENKHFSIYRYDEINNTLNLLESSEFGIHELCNMQDTLKEAHTLIVYNYLPKKNTVKYGDRGLYFALLEAGHSAQNISLVATQLGYGSRCVGQINQKLYHDLSGKKDEVPLYAISIF